MGRDKQTQQGSQSQQYTPTPQEQEMLNMQLEQMRRINPSLTQTQLSGLNTINSLFGGLMGSQQLSGPLGMALAGLDPTTINNMARQSVNDIAPRFQNSGILDSGVAAAISGRVAGDVRNQAAQFNVNNISNLLSMALSGQGQVQAPITAQQGILSNQLSGLRSMTGSSSGSTIGMNPFLRSFQESAGRTLGSPRFSAGPFSFGGGG